MNTPTPKTCNFVELSDIAPQEWDWWNDSFTTTAPWSFGDSNRTLITADRLLAHFSDVMRADAPDGFPEQKLDEFEQMLTDLGTTYIDLEN